jgi:hypothetical protein
MICACRAKQLGARVWQDGRMSAFIILTRCVKHKLDLERIVSTIDLYRNKEIFPLKKELVLDYALKVILNRMQ